MAKPKTAKAGSYPRLESAQMLPRVVERVLRR